MDQRSLVSILAGCSPTIRIGLDSVWKRCELRHPQQNGLLARESKGFRGAMIGIDLFSGAGGMSLGAGQAGIDVKVAVELSASAFATYSRNHPNGTIDDAAWREFAQVILGSNEFQFVD